MFITKIQLSFGGFEAAAPCKGNVSANRMQSDESWLSRAMLRCSLTSPKAKIQHEYPVLQIFSLPNIAPRKFATPSNRHSAIYLRAFLRIFHTRKKKKSGYK